MTILYTPVYSPVSVSGAWVSAENVLTDDGLYAFKLYEGKLSVNYAPNELPTLGANQAFTKFKVIVKGASDGAGNNTVDITPYMVPYMVPLGPAVRKTLGPTTTYVTAEFTNYISNSASLVTGAYLAVDVVCTKDYYIAPIPGTGFYIDYVSIQAGWNPNLDYKYVSKYPQSNSSYGGKANAWSQPYNVSADDAVYASQFVTNLDNQDDLRSTNFGFNLPSEATIFDIYETLETDLSVSIKRNLLVGGLPAGVVSTNQVVSNVPIRNYVAGSHPTGISTWNTILSPAQVNDSSFGVSNTFFFSNSGRTMKLDYVQLTIGYSETTTILPNSFTKGYESTAPRLGLHVAPKNFKRGFEVGSVTLNPYDSMFKNVWYASSVRLTKNLVVASFEHGYDAKSSVMTQKHSLAPASFERGWEAVSVPSKDFTSDYGFETKGPSMTQVHYVSISSAEWAVLSQDKQIPYFESTRYPHAVEKGWKSVGPSLTSHIFMGPAAGGKFGHEMTPVPKLRQFIYGYTPGRRIALVYRTHRTYSIPRR